MDRGHHVNSDHPLIRWQIRDVRPGRSFIVEMLLA
jgi:hypothetical protein